MTPDQIHNEISGLLDKIDRYKQEILIADGAIQAFRYMLAKIGEAAEQVESTKPAELPGELTDGC